LTNVTGWERWATLLTHVDALTRHVRDSQEDTLALASIAVRDGATFYRQGQGQIGPAITGFEEVLTDSTRILGADHPDTLTSRNNLASTYRSAGRLNKAIPLYEATLTDSTRALGDDHPITKTARANLNKARRRHRRR
jgi:hypothetical protein